MSRYSPKTLFVCLLLAGCAVDKSALDGAGLDTADSILEPALPENDEPDEEDDENALSWDASLVVENIPVEVSWGEVESASRLRVRWDRVSTAQAYEVVAEYGDHQVTTVVDSDTSRLVLRGLRSATVYEITVNACEDPQCWRFTPSETAMGVTAPMAWQVVGEGSSYAGATTIIEDSDTKGFGLYYGDDAPSAMVGTVQLYYDSSDAGRKGVNMAVAVETNDEDLIVFDRVDGHGLFGEQTRNADAKGPSTYQPVPLAGGGIRLFFEGKLDGDEHSRLYAIDSQDGDRGQDFHPGTATDCEADDIMIGGACEPTVVMGGEDDGNPGVLSVCQSRLMYPMFDDWRWGQERDSLIIATLHFTEDAEECTNTYNNMGFAVWDGSTWDMEYDVSTGCPVVVEGVESPMPVHMGDGRYMVVFNANTAAQKDMDTGKPLYVLYADAAATGDPEVLEWSDFEARGEAREVQTYWPNGIEIPDVMEQKLDDFGIFSPTGESDELVMYANMSCGDASCEPFIGQLGWVNP
jgi:hypothetical protein